MTDDDHVKSHDIADLVNFIPGADGSISIGAHHNDGYDTTVVLDCGHVVRLNTVPGLPDLAPGDWCSCFFDSAIYEYDRYGGPKYERDRRVTQVRREL